MALNIHAVYRRVFSVWRGKRFARFLATVRPSASDALLDVGGTPAFWQAAHHPLRTIDVLNIRELPEPAQVNGAHIRTVVGDGCALSLADKSYDIGFSNSVIEHVGDWDRQQAFAREIRRVSQALWVQTPAFECPIEPHFLTPFIHYVPRVLRRRIVRWCTVWGWVARPTREKAVEIVDEIRLLSKREVRQLFPDCEILTERMLGAIPKSYIAYRPRRS